MRNPILEEASEVYLRRREYLIVHLIYIAGLALLTVMLWPGRGFMYFFRTESVPTVFQAIMVIQVISVTFLSIYIGLDRLAEAQIIRYSEWLERTAIPIRVLAGGKVITAVLHTGAFVLAAVPFAVVAAGPAGAPIATVLAGEAIVFLSGLAARAVGMLISHAGESSYVLRVVGAWLYVGVLFIATIQIYQPLNPIYAIIRQHATGSPLADTVATGSNAFLASAVPLSILAVVALAAFWVTLARHRSNGRTA